MPTLIFTATMVFVMPSLKIGTIHSYNSYAKDMQLHDSPGLGPDD